MNETYAPPVRFGQGRWITDNPGGCNLLTLAESFPLLSQVSVNRHSFRLLSDISSLIDSSLSFTDLAFNNPQFI